MGEVSNVQLYNLSLRSNGLEGNCGPVHPSELDAEIEIAFVDLYVYPVCFGERYVFAYSSELDDEVDTVLVELLRIRQPAATVQPPVS